MSVILLTTGERVEVDDADLEQVAGHRWYPHRTKSTVYARTSVRDANGGWRTVWMHRMLLDFPTTQQRNQR